MTMENNIDNILGIVSDNINEEIGLEHKNNANVEALDISRADIDYSQSGIKSCRIVGSIFKGVGFFCVLMFFVTTITTISFYTEHKDYLKSESVGEGSYGYEYKLEFKERESMVIYFASASLLLIAFGAVLQIIAYNAKNGAISNNIRYAILKEINKTNEQD